MSVIWDRTDIYLGPSSLEPFPSQRICRELQVLKGRAIRKVRKFVVFFICILIYLRKRKIVPTYFTSLFWLISRIIGGMSHILWIFCIVRAFLWIFKQNLFWNSMAPNLFFLLEYFFVFQIELELNTVLIWV